MIMHEESYYAITAIPGIAYGCFIPMRGEPYRILYYFIIVVQLIMLKLVTFSPTYNPLVGMHFVSCKWAIVKMRMLFGVILCRAITYTHTYTRIYLHFLCMGERRDDAWARRLQKERRLVIRNILRHMTSDADAELYLAWWIAQCDSVFIALVVSSEADP